jgi:hypothetical protein
VKVVYGHVITIPTLEESKGKPMAALFEHIYRGKIPDANGSGAAKN